MNSASRKIFPLSELAEHLTAARVERGFSQAQLAERCGLKRQQITYFETGARLPSLEQLIQIAQALDAPLQRFLSGTNRPGNGLQALALELRQLGLIDLWVESPLVPGAFRCPEEVIVRAIAGREPAARILEGVPALLAWNRWNEVLLWAFARASSRATVNRLAWLADIALTLEQMGGFPGGCRGKEDLAGFLKRVAKRPPQRWDDVGRPSHEAPNSPVWKRWRINYAADLATFRQRADSLLALARAEGRKVTVAEGGAHGPEYH